MDEREPEGQSETARQWAAEARAVRTARAADAEAARRTDAEIEARRRRGYDNRGVAWIGLAVALILGAVGLILVNRLVDQTRLEDCLLAHRRDCASLLDRR